MIGFLKWNRSAGPNKLSPLFFDNGDEVLTSDYQNSWDQSGQEKKFLRTDVNRLLYSDLSDRSSCENHKNQFAYDCIQTVRRHYPSAII